MLGDESQLAYTRLKIGGAHDRVDALGKADHLGHAPALLGCREVVAHTCAQVARGADVERMALGVSEDVDPGGLREVGAEVALLALLSVNA